MNETCSNIKKGEQKQNSSIKNWYLASGFVVVEADVGV